MSARRSCRIPWSACLPGTSAAPRSIACNRPCRASTPWNVPAPSAMATAPPSVQGSVLSASASRSNTWATDRSRSSALTTFLQSGGHEVVRLVRLPPASRAEIAWDPAAGLLERDRARGVRRGDPPGRRVPRCGPRDSCAAAAHPRQPSAIYQAALRRARRTATAPGGCWWRCRPSATMATSSARWTKRCRPAPASSPR